MNAMFFLLLGFTAVTFAITVAFMVKAYEWGNDTRKKIPGAYKHHMFYVKRLAWSLLPPVLGIETILYFYGKGERGYFFWLHMGIVGIFGFIFFGMLLVWTGKRSPKIHSFLSKCLPESFLFVILTGGILMFELIKRL
jgi:hypothetical protein